MLLGIDCWVFVLATQKVESDRNEIEWGGSHSLPPSRTLIDILNTHREDERILLLLSFQDHLWVCELWIVKEIFIFI